MAGRSSVNQGRKSGSEKTAMDVEAYRHLSTDTDKGSKKDQLTFNLVVDDVPYLVKTEAYTFNGEPRYYVSVNGGKDHVFAWDLEASALRAIDDSASILPDAVEEAIAQKLQAKQKRQ